MQQVTQLAPSHGKEIGNNGEHIHQVSEARQAILIDHGLKRTFPLTKNGPNSRGNGSRLSQNPP